MPFGKYKDFAECVTDQKRKGFSDERARKICATIHKKITGKWPTELQGNTYCKCLACGRKIKHVLDCQCEDYVCPKCGGDLISD